MNSSLRIVHMLPALTKGGAERVALDLANASARAGHQVTMIAGWKVDEKVLRAHLDPGVSVVYITEKLSGKSQRYLAGLVWVLANRKWISVQDVLHLHLTQAAVLGSMLYTLRKLCRDAGPAIVETYHAVGMRIPDSLRSFHAWNCRRRDAIAVMALDPYWRKFIDSNPSLIAELIPNGVDAPIGPEPDCNVRSYLDSIGVPRSAKRIVGTVGQFRADRQPKTLMRILINVLKRTPKDVHVLMCGSGGELEIVRQLVAEAGLSDRFTLPGMVQEPRLAMSGMSLYLTLNVGPITGIAALEAAFCGVPIIALQLDPSAELTEADWIWSSADPDAVTQRAVTLLNDSRELLSVGLRQHSDAIVEYSVDTMYRRYIALYRQVLETRQTHSLASKE